MQGKIVQVLGSVVDVAFPAGELPRIRDALYTTADGRQVVMEVSQHLGDSVVRCILLSPPEGLSRDLKVEGPGGGVTVPVGRQVLGRLFGVVGQTIDDGEAVKKDKTAGETVIYDVCSVCGYEKEKDKDKGEKLWDTQRSER